MGRRGRRPAAPKSKPKSQSQPRRGRTAGPPSPLPQQQQQDSVSAAVRANEPRAIEVGEQSVKSSLTNIVRETPEFGGGGRSRPLVRAISPDITEPMPRRLNKRKMPDADKNNPKTRKSNIEAPEPRDRNSVYQLGPIPHTSATPNPDLDSAPVDITEPEYAETDKTAGEGVLNLVECNEIATLLEASDISDREAVNIAEPEFEEIGEATEIKSNKLPEQVPEISAEFNGFQSASTMPSIRGVPDFTDIVAPLSPNGTLSNTESNEILGNPEDVTAIQRDVPAKENDADIAAAADENSGNLAYAKNDNTRETEPRPKPSTFIKTTIEVQGSTRPRQAVINRQISAVVQEFENIGNTTQFRQVLPAPTHATGLGSNHNLNNWVKDRDVERMMTITQNLVRAAETVRFIKSTGQGTETAKPLVEMEQMVSQMLQELESIAVPARYTEANQPQRVMSIKIESSSEDEEP